ncbi:MAG: hypothetical protein AMXMBFR13_07030 [Phycisphaerae bacterium]
MLVTQSLSAETIDIEERVENATEVIARLAGRLAGRLGADAATIERAVLNRERARTTAFANGAAIPHCRLSGLSRFGIAVMILRHPVRWDNEGHAVDTIMMIAGPAENVSDHLRLLANSSQMLDSATFRTKLRRAPDGANAYELITVAEQAVEQRRQETGMLRELHKDSEKTAPGDYLSDALARFTW